MGSEPDAASTVEKPERGERRSALPGLGRRRGAVLLALFMALTLTVAFGPVTYHRAIPPLPAPEFDEECAGYFRRTPAARALLLSLSHGRDSISDTLGVRASSADIVVRARLHSTDTVIERMYTLQPYAGEEIPDGEKDPPNDLVRVVRDRNAVRFRFDVLEYLKGTGGDHLTAFALAEDEWHWSPYKIIRTGDAAEYRDRIDLLAELDRRWDDREAIIFLWKRRSILSNTSEDDHYSIGDLRYSEENPYIVCADGILHYAYPNLTDTFSISSRYRQMWLPLKTVAVDGSGNFERVYYLYEPWEEGGAYEYQADEIQAAARRVDKLFFHSNIDIGPGEGLRTLEARERRENGEPTPTITLAEIRQLIERMEPPG